MAARKRRTRQHIIADLSCNHVERIALLCGYSVERVRADYGYDLILFTYDENGEPETGLIYIQAKATDKLSLLADGETISIRVQRADLELWLRESQPCILVVYDAQADVARWCYVQAHFAGLPEFSLTNTGKQVTVHIPSSRILDQIAMHSIAGFRDAVVQQSPGVRHEPQNPDHR